MAASNDNPTDYLSVSVIQYDIPWCNPSKTIDYLDNKINELSSQTDLIVLPEMWPTGYVMEAADHYETMSGPAIANMQQWAMSIDGAVTGSVAIRDGDNYYNRHLLVDGTGVIGHYDKHHLFGLAGEEEHYTAGSDIVLWEYRGWKLLPQVCYDLRFPVWSRNYQGYDAIIYVASWPRMRHHAWESLLLARAIENQCYVIGCNRIGKDGNGYPYKGGSSIIDYKGKRLVHAGDQAKTVHAGLSKPGMSRFRADFPFLADMDPRG